MDFVSLFLRVQLVSLTQETTNVRFAAQLAPHVHTTQVHAQRAKLLLR